MIKTTKALSLEQALNSFFMAWFGTWGFYDEDGSDPSSWSLQESREPENLPSPGAKPGFRFPRTLVCDPEKPASFLYH